MGINQNGESQIWGRINQGWVLKSLLYKAKEYKLILKIMKIFRKTRILKRPGTYVENGQEKMRLGSRSEAAVVIQHSISMKIEKRG